MSLAWGTISVLVLLLPGFVFFAAVYLPGRFSREASLLNPIGQAATAVLVSLFVHGFLLMLLREVDCSGRIRCPGLGTVLALLQVAPSRPEVLPALGRQDEDRLLDSYLVIEGEDIQNAVFERYEVVLSPGGEARLDAALRQIGDDVTAPVVRRAPHSRTLRFTLPWSPWTYVMIRLGTVRGGQVTGKGN